MVPGLMLRSFLINPMIVLVQVTVVVVNALRGGCLVLAQIVQVVCRLTVVLGEEFAGHFYLLRHPGSELRKNYEKHKSG